MRALKLSSIYSETLKKIQNVQEFPFACERFTANLGKKGKRYHDAKYSREGGRISV